MTNCYEFEFFGSTIRLVKLRNPWGKFEWTGAWGDKDDNWTEDLLTYCGHKRGDDGSFLISYEYYIQYFSLTCLSVEWNPQKYTKSVMLHNFGDEYSLNCKFVLDSEINTKEEIFSITVTQ